MSHDPTNGEFRVYHGSDGRYVHVDDVIDWLRSLEEYSKRNKVNSILITPLLHMVADQFEAVKTNETEPRP